MDNTIRCPGCKASLTLPSVAAQAPARCPHCKALIAPQHAIAAAPIIGASASQAFQAGMPAVVAPPALEDEFDLRIVRPPQDWNVAWGVCGVCGLIAFVDAMVLLLEADKARAIDGVLQGGPLVFWWPDLQSAVNLLSLLSVLTWIAAPFVVLYWIYSAHGSLYALRVQGLSYSPSQAVGMCFIPWLAPYLPHRLMQEIWKASDPTASPDSDNWKLQSGSWLIRLWWACFLLRLVRINITIVPFPVNDPAALTAMLWASCITGAACALGVVAACLFCVIVLLVQRRQWLRYDRLYAPST